MRWSPSVGMRRACAILGTISLVVFVAACGGGGGGGGAGSSGGASGALGAKNNSIQCPSSINTSAAAPESGNITLVVTTWGADPSEIKLDQDGFNSFMQKYPNIKISYQPIPANYDQKMQANVASGNVPDVFYVDQNMAQTYIPAGKLLNLSPYLKRDNINPSDYYQQLMHDFDCANGTVFGIPKDFGTLGLVYNKTLFQQAGVAAPTANWTWTDVQNAAQKLTGNNGPNGKVYGIATSADPARWMAFLYAAGGNVLSSDGKKADFNSQAGVQSAQWWSSFKDSGTGVLPGDVGAGWNGDAFGKERVAMTFEGGWMIPFMTASFPNVQYGIAPMPKAPNGKSSNLLFTNAWGAYSGTKHADAAAKLVEWMTSQDIQTKVLQAGFALPTLQTITQTQASWLGSSDQFNQNVKVLLDNAQGGHSWFYGQAHTEIVTDTSNALQAIMLNHADVKTQLDNAANKVDNWITQNVGP
jgi:multiple sugar transport system substrate-binding protein